MYTPTDRPLREAFQAFHQRPYAEHMKAAVDVARSQPQLAPVFVDLAFQEALSMPTRPLIAQRELLVQGLAIVAGSNKQARERFDLQAPAVMGLVKSGSVAHGIAETALTLQGADLDDVKAHGFVCRDFMLSPAQAEMTPLGTTERNPILFLPDCALFARKSGFIGPAREFAAQTHKTSSHAHVEFSQTFYQQAGHFMRMRDWLPTLPQAVTLLKDKAQANNVGQPAARAPRTGSGPAL